MCDRQDNSRPARPLAAAAGTLLLVAVIGCAANRPTPEPTYFPARASQPHIVHLMSFNALRDLVPSQPGALAFLRGASPSPYVAAPAGVTVHSNHLYICDTGLGVVHDWDLATGASRRLGEREDSKTVTPVDVAVDQAGVVYVADTGRGSVLAFHSLDEPAGKLAPPDQDSFRPVAVAVGRDTLFVADAATHSIHSFSIGSGDYMGAIGRAGSGDGEFYYPMGVDTDGAGRLWVSDMMNGRVQAFDQTGEHLLTFGQRGDRYGDLGKPKHLAAGPDGTVFIADPEFGYVHLFNDQGQLLLLLGGPDAQHGGTPMPLGAAVAPSLPDALSALVPDGRRARYFLFITNSAGDKRIGLYAVLD